MERGSQQEDVMVTIPIRVICAVCGEALEAEIDPLHYRIKIRVKPCECQKSEEDDDDFTD
jgi:hypothetical protein